MAKVEYSWGDGNSSIAKIVHVLNIHDFSGVKNLIPDYAILNSVYLKATWYTNLSGKAEMVMKLNSNDAVIGGTFQISNGTTSTTSTSKDIKGYFNSGKSNVGECTDQLNLSFTASNGIARYWKVPKVWVEIDYTTVHTVTWKNHDGTVLETDSKVPYGTIPTYNGATPTKAETEQYIYTFKGWDKTVVAVTGDVTYTATFSSIRKYTITTYASNGGTAQGGGVYESGTTATLTATPDTGYKFKQWSDGSTANPRTVTVTTNATYTAEFEKLTYTVTFRDTDGTSIYSNQFEYGERLQSLPTLIREGYTFAGWIPCAPVTKMDDTVLDSYQYIGDTAYALHQRYKYADNLSLHIDVYMSDWTDIVNRQIISCTEGGGWGLGYNANTVGHGSEIHTGNYSGIDLGFGTAGKFSNNTWYSFDVIFSKGTFEVYVDGVKKGSVNTPGSAISYNSGNTIFVGAEAGSNSTTPAGNYFKGFISNVFIANQGTRLAVATTSTTVETDVDYYPVWRKDTTHAISTSVSPSTGGTVTDGGVYENGTTIALTATPNTGYKFKQWSDGSTENPRTITVIANATYTAQFERLTYSITASASPIEGGIINGTGIYSHGDTTTLTAIPNPGYQFVKWSDGLTSQSRLLIVNASKNYTALFKLNPLFLENLVAKYVFFGSSPLQIFFNGEKII